MRKLVEIGEKGIPGPTVFIIGDIEPYMDEHMQHEPVYVKSRQHKRQLLKERGLTQK